MEKLPEIQLTSLGKKFGRQVVFKNLSFSIFKGDHIGITGFNGSGKSTLIQVMAGYITPSTGEINHFIKEKLVDKNQLFKHLSFASPYLDLIEEFTATETVDFYSTFKSLSLSKVSAPLLEIAELSHAKDKPVKFYSSGMKQRLKLSLALLSDVEFVFLDEPVSNLDKNAIKWFHQMIATYTTGKIMVISSNDVGDEIAVCNRFIKMEDFKN